MGILDEIGGLSEAGGQVNPGQQGSVAAGLMDALKQHPGGIAGLLQSFRQNGLSDHLESWANGQETTATSQQVEQGLNGTGILENTAQRAGVSHEIASAAIAALLPALIRHFAPGGQATPQERLGGLAEQFMSRVL
jgi:uncharacterized protein YidB (DUF937 family)